MLLAGAAILLVTRLIRLDRGYWHDEILTVSNYVRAGPREILAGPYIPSDHELFSLLGWATSSVFGESETVLRLWSTIPFVLGVTLVVAWLYVRVDPLSGIFFLFFTTASPMLFDISRQAKGYGLAFFAMSVLLVAAFEAERTGRSCALAAFFIAGLVGTLTLPNFGLAFVATALVLISHRALRRRAIFGLAGSALAIVLWYAPHIGGLFDYAGQHDGAQIPWLGLLWSPVDMILVPGVLWFGGTFLTTYPARFFVIAGLAALLVSSPLIREKRAVLLLGSSVALTLGCIWVSRLYLQPRYVSYLLVPLYVLLASGTAHVVQGTPRPGKIRQLLATTTLTVAVAAFVGAAAQLLRFPGEAWKDAAAVIKTSVPANTPVLAYVPRPLGLDFYLEAPVRTLQAPDVVSNVCGHKEAVVYVMQPYWIQPVDVPCLHREGVRYFRFRQYSRGGEINVWIVPPSIS